MSFDIPFFMIAFITLSPSVETAIVDQHPGIPNHSNDLGPGSILLQGIQRRKHCVKVHAPTVDHLWLQQQKSQQQNAAEKRQHRIAPPVSSDNRKE